MLWQRRKYLDRPTQGDRQGAASTADLWDASSSRLGCGGPATPIHLVARCLDRRASQYQNFEMRWFWIALAILVLLAVDRGYLNGQIADMGNSLLHWIAGFVFRWSDDLLRPFRK
jgi:hypothetical protein